MKIKVRPEDFVVDEEASLPLKKGGEYRVYLLTKRGFNTVDLLLRLSKRLGVPFSHFAYGGKKDRHALTSQHITIRDQRVFDIDDDSFTLRPTGEMDRPMGPDLLSGNRFVVVVRDLAEALAMSAAREVEAVRRHGIPNYFDDQRFGSYDRELGFIGEKIVTRQYPLAVRIYLTATHPEDKKTEKERKRYLSRHWGDWEACMKEARTSFEKKLFGTLARREANPYLRAVGMIPREELSMYFAAWQSYLWNRLAERVLVSVNAATVLRYRGNYWDYHFYRSLPPGEARRLSAFLIPTPSQNARMPDAPTERLYADLLAEHQLKPSSFNIRKIRTAFFKSNPRPLVIVPAITAADLHDDEIYPGKKKLILQFALPKGSYGTMLVKRLLAGGQMGE